MDHSLLPEPRPLPAPTADSHRRHHGFRVRFRSRLPRSLSHDPHVSVPRRRGLQPPSLLFLLLKMMDFLEAQLHSCQLLGQRLTISFSWCYYIMYLSREISLNSHNVATLQIFQTGAAIWGLSHRLTIQRALCDSAANSNTWHRGGLRKHPGNSLPQTPGVGTV